MSSIIKRFDNVCQLMHGALMHKDQQVALAASEFWSGILETTLENNDEQRVQKIQEAMDLILPALLECCVMTDADRMADVNNPTSKDSDTVDPKQIENEEDEDNNSENQDESYTTLRKSSAFTLQLFAKNFSDHVFDKI